MTQSYESFRVSGARVGVSSDEAQQRLKNDQENAVEAPGRYTIRAVDRAFDILDVLACSDVGVTLVAIAKVVSMPKSSVFRYLTTLERRGQVVRGDGDVFTLGARHDYMRPREVAQLCAAAAPKMQELSRRFKETINLGTLDRHRVVYLEVVESTNAMRFAAKRGSSDPIHSSALGKIISSSLGDEEVRRILAVEGMPVRTSRTITSPDTFLRELCIVRAQGFAIDEGENEDGGRCVAVLLPFSARAAISLSAPAARLPRESLVEVAATLRLAAEDIAQDVRNARS